MNNEFEWIKAHAGNLGKELADLLATDEASDKDISVIFVRIPKNTLQNKLEKEFALKWQEEW